MLSKVQQSQPVDLLDFIAKTAREASVTPCVTTLARHARSVNTVVISAETSLISGLPPSELGIFTNEIHFLVKLRASNTQSLSLVKIKYCLLDEISKSNCIETEQNIGRAELTGNMFRNAHFINLNTHFPLRLGSTFLTTSSVSHRLPLTCNIRLTLRLAEYLEWDVKSPLRDPSLAHSPQSSREIILKWPDVEVNKTMSWTLHFRRSEGNIEYPRNPIPSQ